MGEIADSLIDGEFDFYTGEYIGRGVGYPRTLDRSLPWERRNKSNPVGGVLNYLNIKGFNKNNRVSVLQEYAKLKKWDVSEENPICEKIQEKFGDFKSWLGNYIKNNPLTH
jgi:hypothetical protein